MTRCRASFLSLLCFGVCFVFLHRSCIVEAILKDACPDEARIILSPEERSDKLKPTSMRNLTEFDKFPPDLTWFANGSTYGCICDVFSCVRLCCAPGFLSRNVTCIPADDAFINQWPSIHFKNLTLKPNDDFFPIIGHPCGGASGYALDPSGPAGPRDEFHLLDDGSIHTVTEQAVTDRYCLYPLVSTYVPMLCFPTNPDLTQPLEPVKITAIVISIPFLLVTLIIYVLLPELNTIHGLTLRCYVASLGVSFTFLTIDRFASLKHFIGLCRFIGLGIIFPNIASFMWLNVMCIDIWRTFGSRNTSLVVHSGQKRRTFLLYSIYAWGIASIMSCVGIYMELAPGLSEDLIRPGIASGSRCWFASLRAELAYFYGPIGVILICNLFLFVATAMKMIWHQRTIAPQLNSNPSTYHHESKKWFILYIKLFVVMGINWTTDVISWWWQGDDLEYLWYVTDTVNALQGFSIFIILVCKRKVIRSLKKRFKNIRHPGKDNELSLNASRRTRNNTSSCQVTKSLDMSTSESILTSNSLTCEHRRD